MKWQYMILLTQVDNWFLVKNIFNVFVGFKSGIKVEVAFDFFPRPAFQIFESGFKISAQPKKLSFNPEKLLLNFLLVPKCAKDPSDLQLYCWLLLNIHWKIKSHNTLLKGEGPTIEFFKYNNFVDSSFSQSFLSQYIFQLSRRSNFRTDRAFCEYPRRRSFIFSFPQEYFPFLPRILSFFAENISLFLLRIFSFLLRMFSFLLRMLYFFTWNIFSFCRKYFLFPENIFSWEYFRSFAAASHLFQQFNLVSLDGICHKNLTAVYYWDTINMGVFWIGRVPYWVYLIHLPSHYTYTIYIWTIDWLNILLHMLSVFSNMVHSFIHLPLYCIRFVIHLASVCICIIQALGEQ